MYTTPLTATLLFIGLCFLRTLPAFGAVHEQLATTPYGWTRVATPDDSSTIILQIGLQEQNLDQLESLLYAVSTPGSTQYGDYMEANDVKSLLQPSSEANSAVLAWLKQAGVDTVYSDGTWVNFATTVATANRLLNTQFNYYDSEGITKLRTTQYSVPDELTQHIDLVTPTTFFGKPKAQAPTIVGRDRVEAHQVDASCALLITPRCLKQLYSINYTPDPKSGSRIAFGSFLNQSARAQDLRLFETTYKIPHQSFSVELVNGGVNDQSISSNHAEANLDIEYIVGVSHPLPVLSYITGGSPPFIPNLDQPTHANNTNEPYLDYYSYLLSKQNSELPQVITNSYCDDEQTVPEKYARRVCNMIGQLGLRGLTILASSGDTGKLTYPYLPRARVGAPCQSNDGKRTPEYTPQFPPTCPYITSVGGTQSISPEVAWVASTGGFSNYFKRPDYQSSAVSTYLTKYIGKAALDYFKPYFNIDGRAFPDVAAHSLRPDYSVVVNNKRSLSGGTSAATPVFASIIALLNDARLRAGKKQLGYLNPWLYSIGFEGLTDITAGGSVGCNGTNGQTGKPVPGNPSIIPYASWNATTGWDPVTGLGVPNFEKLLALAMA